jgi:hypothetical protein
MRGIALSRHLSGHVLAAGGVEGVAVNQLINVAIAEKLAQMRTAKCFADRRPTAATLLKGCFWGYPRETGIRNPINSPSFSIDFESVPGSQLNQSLMLFCCHFTALFLRRQLRLSLLLRFLNRGPEFSLCGQSQGIALVTARESPVAKRRGPQLPVPLTSIPVAKAKRAAVPILASTNGWLRL